MRDGLKNAMIVAAAGLLALAVSAGRAPGEGPPGAEPYPVTLAVGETFKVCKSGELICPATTPICDDLAVVEAVDTPDGLGFRGIAPGTTLCSAAGVGGLRRVFRITVRPSR